MKVQLGHTGICQPSQLNTLSNKLQLTLYCCNICKVCACMTSFLWRLPFHPTVFLEVPIAWGCQLFTTFLSSFTTCHNQTIKCILSEKQTGFQQLFLWNGVSVLYDIVWNGSAQLGTENRHLVFRCWPYPQDVTTFRLQAILYVMVFIHKHCKHSVCNKWTKPIFLRQMLLLKSLKYCIHTLLMAARTDGIHQ